MTRTQEMKDGTGWFIILSTFFLSLAGFFYYWAEIGYTDSEAVIAIFTTIMINLICIKYIAGKCEMKFE